LIVDDNLEDLESFKAILRGGFSTLTASSFEEAKRLLSSSLDIALLDIRLDDTDPSNREGLELLKHIKSELPHLPVIMITAYGDVDIAVEAMKLGAADFIQKEKVSPEEVKKRVSDVLEKTRLQRKISELEEDISRLESWEIIGDDPKILNIKKLIDIVAKDGEITVLIEGETGTGKELVARAIHKRGVRKDGPFISVAVSSLTSSLLESELFGHEKGAFTGADRRKIGYIERAHKGVLFLDEIGELSKEAQVKLLRFLDSKTFTRVGGEREIRVDVQLLAATNKDLKRAVEEGEFREDLYYRLNTFRITLPTLAERKGDIPKLAYHFLNSLRSQGRTKLKTISDPALELLKGYNWPGNVRELKNCIERAAIYAENHGHDRIMPDDLPLEIRKTEDRSAEKFMIDPEKGVNVNRELARIELAYIEEALRITGGKRSEAWKLLGYNDRFALRRRIKSIFRRFPELRDEYPFLK